MPTSLSRRLCVLEQWHPAIAFKGYRTVFTLDTLDPRIYWSRPAGYSATDMRWALPDASGYPPAGAPTHTAADIEVMQAAGWQVTIVEYVSNWRPDAVEVADEP